MGPPRAYLIQIESLGSLGWDQRSSLRWPPIDQGGDRLRPLLATSSLAEAPRAWSATSSRALITPISPLEDTLNPCSNHECPHRDESRQPRRLPIVPTTMEIGANHNPKPIAEKNKVIKAPSWELSLRGVPSVPTPWQCDEQERQEGKRECKREQFYYAHESALLRIEAISSIWVLDMVRGLQSRTKPLESRIDSVRGAAW